MPPQKRKLPSVPSRARSFYLISPAVVSAWHPIFSNRQMERTPSVKIIQTGGKRNREECRRKNNRPQNHFTVFHRQIGKLFAIAQKFSDVREPLHTHTSHKNWLECVGISIRLCFTIYSSLLTHRLFALVVDIFHPTRKYIARSLISHDLFFFPSIDTVATQSPHF